MRLFVAVVPPPEVLGDLDTAVAPYRAGRTPGRDLRWSGPEDWHLTLAFLGDGPEPVADRLGPELARAAHRHPPFPLALAGAGAFPSAGCARVLWCGLSGDRPALASLAASVAAAATRAGAPPTDPGRPFRPHLTLARGRTPADLGDLVAALSPYQGPQWPVDRLELIESHLGGRPRYTTIGRWSLDGDTL
jgi:RNA 2',3'-cyclic 3'-phosphodiesterase